MTKKTVCLLGTSSESKGGIGTVVRAFEDTISVEGYSFVHVVTHEDKSSFQKVVIAISSYLHFVDMLKQKKFDLIHIHSAFGASFDRSKHFIRAAKKANIPVINHIHADSWESFYEKASEKKRKEIQEVYAQCDLLIALSPEWKSIITDSIPGVEVVILENCTPIYEPSFKPQRDKKTILFMSRLEKIKGCDILPEIIRRTCEAIPEAKFIICGEGSERKKLQDSCLEYCKSGNVCFPGWIDDEKKVELLKNASILLLPSYGEGMPMCILEAMGLGLPVVASEVGGIPQLIDNGTSGFMCTPGCPDGYSSSIVSLLSNVDLYESISFGSKEVARKHSIPEYEYRLKMIYDNLVKL